MMESSTQPGNEEHIVDKVERLYALICSRKLDITKPLILQQSVNIVQKLEKLTYSSFHDTKDFHIKIQAFLSRKRKPHTNLRDLRRRKGYSSNTMAVLTGVSFKYYSDMERGRKPLNKKALDMIRGITNS